MATYLRKPLSSNVLNIVVANESETTMLAYHCMVGGEDRSTDTVAWCIVKFPIIL